jgi:hypothetical protein
MTRAEYEITKVASDIESAEETVAGAIRWMHRMSLEMTDAIKEGRRHDCQVQNLTSAVASLAIEAERLNGLRNAKKMMEAMISG